MIEGIKIIKFLFNIDNKQKVNRFNNNVLEKWMKWQEKQIQTQTQELEIL